MNTLISTQITHNSTDYLLVIKQSPTETLYYLDSLSDGSKHLAIIEDTNLSQENASKLASDLQKNPIHIKTIDNNIVIDYGFLNVSFVKQKNQEATSRITNSNNLNDRSQLLQRLDHLEERIKYGKELKKKVSQLKSRVNDFENTNIDCLPLSVQNYYSSEQSEKTRLFFGSTNLTDSNWKTYTNNTHLKIEIDLSKCNFASTPTIFTSLGGKNYHCSTKGTSSVYSATNNSFYAIVRRSGITTSKVKPWKWHLNWVAIGDINN
ncbi:hypothetical protein M0812_22560 [Anaeramoeba flamelloides]|uniref:Uncharacterized protein n=1 Tax=Anaeramoeba flamelloides TaxID=1746091 RepID=A0AAV7YUW2_9EUKA|nr:hypothetical protein M0812_22560 [Anaeramoeba flamelloides]